MPARFVPRERKHRRLAKLKEQGSQSQHGDQRSDSNAPELPSVPASEREEKRQRLHAELRPETKMSSKKKKRLDKYIDVKMRREENKELLKKLEASKVDTSLFQSSKKLGRMNESKREQLQRALNERAAGIADGDDILFETRQLAPDADEDESDDESTRENHIVPIKDTPTKPTEPEASAPTVSAFGSGLKRPLAMDESGQPILKKRKRQKKAKASAVALMAPESDLVSDEESLDGSEADPEDADEWHGFDSDCATADDDNDDDDDGSNDDDNPSEDPTDSEQSTDDESEESPEEDATEKRTRVSAFKQWADAQRNVASDFTPSFAITDMAAIKANFIRRAPSPDLLVQQIPTSASPSRPAGAITIPRSEDVQTARLQLPVVQEEQKIMEAVHNNPVVVLCGATGSGKTTQVPQMLFENGYGSRVGSAVKDSTDGRTSAVLQSYGMIGITQPRRVAATSVADRVSHELGSEYQKRVAHQVRYDTNVSRDTAIKFMTDGILLREIQQDFVLSKYSAIVLDEAHERSVNTDILIGILSRIVSLREELTKEEPGKHYPLKLIIMSATLRINDFLGNQRLFKNGVPPVIEAEGRQFPVTVHFSRRTRRDYVEEIVEKLSRGHRKLPPGTILVFLTGQQEIQAVSRQLRETLGGSASVAAMNGTRPDREADMPLEIDDFEDSRESKRPSDYLEGEEDAPESDDGEGDKNDADDTEFAVEEDPSFPSKGGALKPYILPLYAALPASQQMKVFQAPPENHRMIILATNVAETSLTIPGVRYVFDCGRSKEKRCDAAGVQTFEIDWISKASASQRTGRAGRTGAGHCYRLYSSAVFENHFEEHTAPEILRTPLESTVLQLKAMNIDNVVNFPFPTPPDRDQLAQSERLLKNLGAIDERTGKITDRGKDLTRFPLSPRYGVMLLLAERNNVVDKTIALVAGLAVGDLFVNEVQASSIREAINDAASSDEDSEAAEPDTGAQHQAYTRAQAMLSRWDDQSDAVKLLTTVAAHADTSSKSSSAGSKFCTDFFLRDKGMQEVQQLRQQLHSIVATHLRSTQSAHAPSRFSPSLSPPSEQDRAKINQIVAAGFIDQIAIRADLLPDAASAAPGRKPRRAIDVAYRTLVPSIDVLDRAAAPDAQHLRRSVFVHPASVLARLAVAEMPSYIVYAHLSRAAATTVAADEAAAPLKKTRLHPLATIGPKALAVLAEGTPLLSFGKPIGKIEELPTKRRRCWVGLGLRAPGAGGVEWPLGAWKVLQKRGARGEWETEKVLAR